MSGLASALATGSNGSGVTSGTTADGGTATHYLQPGNMLLQQVDYNNSTLGSASVGTTSMPTPTTNASFLGTVAGGDFIGWGYWAAGTNTVSGSGSSMQDVHYVVGTPTPTMPTTGSKTYGTVLGYTQPTFTTSGPAQSVTFGSASLDVNFQAGNGHAQVDVTVGSTPVSISGTVHVDGATFATNAAAPAPTHIGGIFVGSSGGFPARAGMVYSQDITSGGPGGRVAGAVVLGP